MRREPGGYSKQTTLFWPNIKNYSNQMSDLIKNSERNMGVHYQRYITKWLPWGVDYN